jgi:Mn2+/Fe2+ NRAMP family transporter
MAGKTDARRKTQLAAILASMGPGLLTAFAGNDAGGIATYSTTGATYGLGMIWTVPIMCLLLIVVQETAARMGCATGKGFASLIRERFGVRVSVVAMLSLIVSNFAVTLSEFAGHRLWHAAVWRSPAGERARERHRDVDARHERLVS